MKGNKRRAGKENMGKKEMAEGEKQWEKELFPPGSPLL